MTATTWARLLPCTLLVLLAACPKPPAPRVQRLVLGTTLEPDSLNPLLSDNAGASELIFLTQRELTHYDPSWRLVPDLAVRLPSAAAGDVVTAPTGELTVTWHLREDARWADSAPVVADDFVLAWQLANDPQQPVVRRDTAAKVAHMGRGADDKTLVVRWKEPSPFYDDFRVHPCLPSHVMRPRLETAPGVFSSLKADPQGQRPLGNGPFSLKAWVPGQYLSFQRNEQARPRAGLDEVVVKLAPSTTALTSMLLAGDIDAVLPSGGLSGPEVAALTAQAPGRFQVAEAPGLVWAHIDFNLDDPWLKDVRVRRAITQGFDRVGIVQKVYGPSYTVAETFLPPRHWGHARDVRAPAFDRAAAAGLLEQAGWTLPPGAPVRVNAQGQPLRITLSLASGQKEGGAAALAIQSDLAKVGVEVALDEKPFKVFFGELARHRKLPHLALYAWVLDPATFGATMWQDDMIPSEANGWKGQNFAGWRDPEVTALLRQVGRTLDEGERAALLARVQARYVEDLPAIPLYFRPVLAVSKVGLRHFTPTGTQTPSSFAAARWAWSAP